MRARHCIPCNRRRTMTAYMMEVHHSQGFPVLQKTPHRPDLQRGWCSHRESKILRCRHHMPRHIPSCRSLPCSSPIHRAYSWNSSCTTTTGRIRIRSRCNRTRRNLRYMSACIRCHWLLCSRRYCWEGNQNKLCRTMPVRMEGVLQQHHQSSGFLCVHWKIPRFLLAVARHHLPKRVPSPGPDPLWFPDRRSRWKSRCRSPGGRWICWQRGGRL